MRNASMARRLALAVVVFGLAGGGLAAIAGIHHVAAQADSATIKIVPPGTPLKKGDKSIPIEIDIENAKNMAAFQFDLKFNADIFAAIDQSQGEFAQKGDFLGSSGREVVCNSATDTGLVRFTCVTLRPAPLGPDGNGKLATVFLNVIGSGSTDLSLDRLLANQVTDDIHELPTTTQSVSVVVKGNGGGTNWLLYGSIIGAVVVVLIIAGGFAAMRARGGRGGEPAPVMGAGE